MNDSSKITPDYSMNFRDIRDKFLNSSEYRKFLKTLNPFYWKVYLDLGIGYLFIFLSLLIASKIELFSLISFPLLIILSINLGFWIAYLTLFVHEGAHYNLSKNKKINKYIIHIYIKFIFYK